jgi:stage II sporulation protein P
MRYVILRKERFNQHVAPGAIIVEMGATGNTMEEVLRSADLFAEILVEIIE